MILLVLKCALYVVVAVMGVYAVRHYVFTLNRVFGRQRSPYIDIEVAEWPPVTVLVPAHNEEQVIESCLTSLLKSDYPSDKLHILPINDSSTDGTAGIVDHVAAQYPGQVTVMHRCKGKRGKAAALKDAMQLVQTEIVIIFDADYVPNRGLLKRLVAPFFDPEIGSVMGRVVPGNVTKNLLTRLLDLERSGGYQVDQQARMNLKLVPQYGGTLGGIRRSALATAGGWNEDSLTEDTDATFRLLLKGWKTAYENRAECYEEVPEDWASRSRQIRRWASGHNEAMVRYVRSLFRSKKVSWQERTDGVLLLGIYASALLLLIGWSVALALFYLSGDNKGGIIALLSVAAYLALGNFAPFFEIAAATRLDSSPEKAKLLPLMMLSFLASIVAVAQATVLQLAPANGRPLVWHKTPRFRNRS